MRIRQRVREVETNAKATHSNEVGAKAGVGIFTLVSITTSLASLQVYNGK
jgi:hypothetical protein